MNVKAGDEPLLRLAVGGKSGWCRNDFNWGFGWRRLAWSKRFKWLHRATALLERVFYTGKAIVCVLLRRETNMWAEDGITVAAWDMRPWSSMDFVGYAYDWSELSVRPGYLRGWQFGVYETSSA